MSPLLKFLLEAGFSEAVDALRYARGETDEKPPALRDLPDLDDNELEVVRLKARRAAVERDGG